MRLAVATISVNTVFGTAGVPAGDLGYTTLFRSVGKLRVRFSDRRIQKVVKVVLDAPRGGDDIGQYCLWNGGRTRRGLGLHDALPICWDTPRPLFRPENPEGREGRSRCASRWRRYRSILSLERRAYPE